MQTREPRRRVNWIFVAFLIAVPLIVIFLVMMNTVPTDSTPPAQVIDSVHVQQDSVVINPDDSQ